MPSSLFRRLAVSTCAAAALAAPALAQERAPAAVPAPLALVPQPKSVRLAGREFTLASPIRIVVDPAHATEDAAAAESLAAEFQQRGLEAHVVRSRSARQPGIYLTRAEPSQSSAAPAASGISDPEAYFISTGPDDIVVTASTAEGVFYGAQTVRQLVRARGNTLVCPALRIEDWPSMRWRGVHIDISRGPVPTLEMMKQQVRVLASYKINLYALYIEHTFAYSSQPLAAPAEGALTPGEIRDLVSFAARYHVTVLPEQQAFGHLHGLLKYEIYSNLAEIPHGFVLTPTNPESYHLIGDLHADLAPLFPGPFFHVGGDETFELGTGRTRQRAQEIGLGRVYLEHLQRVYQLMKPYDKRLLFWGDIAVKYPQLLGTLPKDMIAVPWNYEAQPAFDNLILPFRAAGLDVIVAPGAGNWGAIFPNLDVAYTNIRNFARDGQKHHALGMLNTTWNDDGESLLQMSWPALLFGAAAGWQPGESSVADFQAKYDWAFLRSQGQAFAGILEDLARAESLVASARPNETSDNDFWRDPFTPEGVRAAQAAQGVARNVRLAAERALIALYRNRSQAQANASSLDALVFAALRYDLLGMKWQYTAEINHAYWDAYQNARDKDRVVRDLSQISGLDGIRLEDLRDGTTRLRALYPGLWNRENRPYWLPNVLVRYDLLAQTFQKKIEQVRAVEARFNREGILPPPDQLGFYWRP
jgi:hexosaminidase